MSSRLAPDEKICSVRELICSVSGRVCCTSLWQGLTNLPPCIWNFGQNQCATLPCTFVLSGYSCPLSLVLVPVAGSVAVPGRLCQAAGRQQAMLSVSKLWGCWWWGLEKEKNSEKMQEFSKPVAGLRGQRSLLQKLKRGEVTWAHRLRAALGVPSQGGTGEHSHWPWHRTRS